MHHQDAEEIVEQWIAFSCSNSNCALTLEHLEHFQNNVWLFISGFVRQLRNIDMHLLSASFLVSCERTVQERCKAKIKRWTEQFIDTVVSFANYFIMFSREFLLLYVFLNP